MASYRNYGDVTTLPQEIRLQDLETHKSLGETVLANLLKKSFNPGHTFSAEEQSQCDAFTKQINQTTIRDQLEDVLIKYIEPVHSVASLKELNMIYFEENRGRQARRGENMRISNDHQITISKDGSASGFLYSERRTVKLKYTTTVQEEVFLGVLLAYSDWDNKVNIQAIQTLTNYLNKAQELGIPFKDLSSVLIFYVKKTIPDLLGQMSPEAYAVKRNYEIILNHLSVKDEKLKIEDKLKNVERKITENILKCYLPLHNMYRAYFSLSTILTKENAQSANMEIDKQSDIYSRRALRSLTSEKTQINISKCLSTYPDGKIMPQKTFEELISKADTLYPPRGNMKLPKELCLLQESSQAINLCLQAEEPILAVQYPYQKPPSTTLVSNRRPSPGKTEGSRRVSPYRPGSPGQRRSTTPGQNRRITPGGPNQGGRTGRQMSPVEANRRDGMASRSTTPTPNRHPFSYAIADRGKSVEKDRRFSHCIRCGDNHLARNCTVFAEFCPTTCKNCFLYHHTDKCNANKARLPLNLPQVNSVEKQNIFPPKN